MLREALTKKGNAMTKWEYKIQHFESIHNMTKPMGSPTSQSPSLLESLGKDGWELVQVLSNPEDKSFEAVFKRELQVSPTPSQQMQSMPVVLRKDGASGPVM